MSHTPGPWRFHKQPSPNNEHLTGFAIYGEDATVADIFPASYPVHINEDNARLIAAAPELLEACREAIEFLSEGTPICEGSCVHASLVAAISKATQPA